MEMTKTAVVPWATRVWRVHSLTLVFFHSKHYITQGWLNLWIWQNHRWRNSIKYKWIDPCCYSRSTILCLRKGTEQDGENTRYLEPEQLKNKRVKAKSGRDSADKNPPASAREHRFDPCSWKTPHASGPPSPSAPQLLGSHSWSYLKPQLLGACSSRALEAQLMSPCAATAELSHPSQRVTSPEPLCYDCWSPGAESRGLPQPERPLQWEKAHRQQQRPGAAKNN